MRYQERIYIQNNNHVRNKNILNFNMSSDICVFNEPLFFVSGASKIGCTCVCPSNDSVIAHDTYSGFSFYLSSITNPNTDTVCEDITTTIRAGLDTARHTYNLSGASAVNNIFFEYGKCSKITKIRSGGEEGCEEGWIVQQPDGSMDIYHILDYTNTESTIMNVTPIITSDCCHNISSSISTFNSFVNSVTGMTQYLMDVPYTSSTSCDIASIPCDPTTGTTYIISTATTIPLIFEFTGNTSTLSGTNGNFKYEVYQFNKNLNNFILPPVYVSPWLEYSSITATTSFTSNLPVNSLPLDGEFIIKGYNTFGVCTNFLNALGKTIDTTSYRIGTNYGLYDPELDYYFIAIQQAETPTLINSISNSTPSSNLFQQTFPIIAGQTVFTLSNGYIGNVVVTLNGLVLSNNYDYTISGNVITLTSSTLSDDIVTAIYTTTGGNNFIGDNINISSSIVSGTTGNQGSNSAYFNISTGKYEIYTNNTPLPNSSIIVMINGVTLASGIDYYQSSSNPKRIILEGDLVIGDIITIVYYGITNVANGVYVSNPIISWTVSNPINQNNGYFSLQVSENILFNSLVYSGFTSYSAGTQQYSDSFTVSGTVGTNLYYRVYNEKDYTTICDEIIKTTACTETITITIQTNSINTY